jgi:mRNA interferase MazF
MIACNFGDIVLIEFPHTDMRGVSRRPALVLNDSGDLDVLVARITSQEQSTKSDYKVIDWRKCGRLDESYIRLGKLAIIEKNFITRKLGNLESNEILKIKAIMRTMFSL